MTQGEAVVERQRRFLDTAFSFVIICLFIFVISSVIAALLTTEL